MHGRSKRSGCGQVQVGPITISQTKRAHEIVLIKTTKPSLLQKLTAAHHRANFIDKKVSNVVLEFSSIVNTRCMAIPYEDEARVAYCKCA